MRVPESAAAGGRESWRQAYLGLSARTVEERARLERELWHRPALRDARKAGLSYAKLKLLARLPDRLVREWIGKAMGMTCIDLARELESDRDRNAILAQHFLEIYRAQVKRPKTRAQKVRERDHDCQVPGCSGRAMHSHHKQSRSHGGSDEMGNQLGLCAYHHLRCIHTGYLVLVTGEVTGEHRWYVKGERFRGGVAFDGPARVPGSPPPRS